MAGAANGNNISLSATQWGIQVLAMSGTAGWNRLTLTGGFSGGQPNTMVLVRSDLSDYQSAVDRLNERSKDILTTRAAAANHQQAIRRMQRFDAEADVELGKFPGVEHWFQEITAKMGEYLEKERRLAGSLNASVARSQSR